MKKKATVEDIRNLVKELEKRELKPDGNGTIPIEMENLKVRTDFLYKPKKERR